MVRLSLVPRAVMRAVRVHQWGGPDVLKVESGLAIPVPGQDQVLIKVQAAGVNPVDTYIRSGTYAKLPQLPYIPGSDAAGVVEAVGEKVTEFKKGDRAYTLRSVSGAYSDFAVSDVLYTAHLADNLTFAQGAALGVPYYTAYRALIHKAKVKPGETILIHGASGSVGLASVQIATAMGLRVLGTAGTAEGLQLVSTNGASAVFNHREEGYISKIMTATGGDGPNVIIEMLSNVNLQHDLEMIKFQGRLVVVGCRGTVEINPRLMMAKELQVLGVMLGSASPDEFREMHAFLKAGATTGWLQPQIGRVYALKDVADAHTDVVSSTGACGKLVLKL